MSPANMPPTTPRMRLAMMSMISSMIYDVDEINLEGNDAYDPMEYRWGRLSLSSHQYSHKQLAAIAPALP